jgi:hypothetical protein
LQEADVLAAHTDDFERVSNDDRLHVYRVVREPPSR